MKPSCNRTWEVEAARDGRLGEAARAELDAHLSRCSECAKERASFQSLGERLRATPSTTRDDLGLRRLRGQVLARVDAATKQAKPGSRRFFGGVAVLAGALVAFFVVFGRGGVAPSEVPVEETKLVTTDEGGARWSSHDDGNTRQVDLLDGTLAIGVEHARGGKRVVVRVPDGEIEDVGTRFHVSVTDGHTRHVRVDEGLVIVRLAGQSPIALTAGQKWERPSPPAAPPSGVNSALPPPAPSVRVVVSAPRPSAVPTPRPMPSQSASDEEDLAYLEIVRLLREGRDADARAASRDYLRRFPGGFRRAEVERVLTPR
jgi:hypothetical protein